MRRIDTRFNEALAAAVETACGAFHVDEAEITATGKQQRKVMARRYVINRLADAGFNATTISYHMGVEVATIRYYLGARRKSHLDYIRQTGATCNCRWCTWANRPRTDTRKQLAK